jgi:outer membrane protein OmpA-like peptidoglycan-associated protein/tetratricopeptide (TPR) repeat protein
MQLKKLIMNQFCAIKINIWFCVITSIMISAHSMAQTPKKLLEEAEKFYAYGDYYTAARLYEQYLNPETAKKDAKGLPVYNSLTQRSKSSAVNLTKTDVIYKLANAYRLSFYFPQAAEQYKTCYTTAADKYPDSYYWYAVCMRSIGNYAEARSSLQTFLSSYASNSSLKSAAEAEQQTLDFIDQQLKRPDTILYVIKKADNIIGVEKGVYAAASAGASKLMVTSTIKDSSVKKNRNPYRNRLFYANEASDHTIQGLELVTISDMDVDANQGTAVLHPNGEFLYFTQWVKTKEKSVAEILLSRRKDGKWSAPEKLLYVNAAGSNSKQPAISSDGKSLFFASDRAGGSGGYDIWSTTIDANGLPEREPSNLGSSVNTAGEDQAPYFQPTDNVLIFSTNGRPGMGGFDLFMTKGSEGQWNAPQNLGYPINSTRDDIYYYNASKEFMKNAFLSSDRGSNCCLETYALEKLPKKRKITGQLVACENSEPLPDAEVELNPGSGNKVRTNAEGKFSFDLKEGDNPAELVFSKDSFIAKTTQYKVVDFNEQDPLTNIWMNETVCLDKPVVIKPENISILYFDFDKSKLRKEGKALLDSVYDVLSNNPSYALKVDAHTDSKGSEEYNIKLSKRRADAVVKYLVKKGVAESRITYEAFGKTLPAEEDMPNGVYEPNAAQKNRRALLHITKP